MEPSDALHNFRCSFYECLHRRGDALFELADAILSTDAAAPSPVHLSLEPAHRRGWGASTRLWPVDVSTRGYCATCSSAIRSQGAERRPSTPWTRACGPDATRSAAPSEDTTTILPAIRRGSRSWPDGPTSS